MIVLNSIIAKIKNHAVKDLRDSFYYGTFPAQSQGYMSFSRCGLQTICCIFGNSVKINRLPLHSGRSTIQVNNIFHQGGQAQCFLPDFMRKGLDILLFYHSIFHQFGVTGNGVQRRFQFMRNICGKLLPDL